jgi:mono/diheme cytochrome c family protein
MTLPRLFGAVVVLATATTACAAPGRLLRGYAEAEPDGMELLEGPYAHAPDSIRGQVRFVFDDFGSLTTDGLRTYGIPWTLAAAAVVLDRERHQGAPRTVETLNRALEEYGFLRPTEIANWVGPQPDLDRPLGLLAGTARRGFPAVEIEIGNLGCATCHAGPLYGPDGRPTGKAWLGSPNASIDVTAYAADVFQALRAGLEAPDELLAAVEDLYPAVRASEISTLRKHVVPGAREELARRDEEYGGLVPFRNGGPGLNNGAGSLRFLHGGDETSELHRSASWASAPDLVGTTLRRSVLVDGIYAPPRAERYGPLAVDAVTDQHLSGLAGVVSLFIVGTQGIDPARARAAIPEVHEVMRYLHTLDAPPFPGEVDHELAARGAEVYRAACASCHGSYSAGTYRPRLMEHPNRLVAQERMHTDSLRWVAADSTSLALLDRIGYREVIEPLNGGGYVAPDLSGVWATAPYLHNGSVPTLWHLLHTDERPKRFMVGGHALDYERVGIAGDEDGKGVYRYPKGYVPWSRALLYDVREPGRSNSGHEFRTLSEPQKRALLEYMKVL